MDKLSEHFSRSEFACKCGCGFAAVDVKLLELLEIVRERFNSPVTINSACRCEHHNAAVGGASGSKHKKGIAADIVVRGVSPDSVYEFVDSHLGPFCGGVGKYKSFTHVDVRGSCARWEGLY